MKPIREKDVVFFIRAGKPKRGVVISVKGDGIAVDVGDTLAWLDEDDVFHDKAAACMAGATRSAKNAAERRRRRDEVQVEVERYEAEALELSAIARRTLRGEVEEADEAT